MPWKVVKGLGCPPDKPYAVTKHDADGNPIGERLGCHATRAEANRQLAALYASEQARQSQPPLDPDVTRWRCWSWWR